MLIDFACHNMQQNFISEWRMRFLAKSNQLNVVNRKTQSSKILSTKNVMKNSNKWTTLLRQIYVERKLLLDRLVAFFDLMNFQLHNTIHIVFILVNQRVLQAERQSLASVF